MRAALTTLSAGVLALALASCGSSNANSVVPVMPTGTATTAPVTTSTTAPVTTTATTAAAARTRTAATASPATVTTQTITAPSSGGAGLTGAGTASACVAADLRAAAVPPNGATGTVVLGFTLTNTSGQPCHTYGWPGFAFLDAAGSVADAHTQRSSQDALGPTPARAFTIAPGAEASFRVAVRDSNDQGGEGGCGTYPGVQIIVPDDTASLRVSLPDGSVTVCGTAQVSPLAPGTVGTGQ